MSRGISTDSLSKGRIGLNISNQFKLLIGQKHPDDELRQQTIDLIQEMEKQGFRQTIDPDAALEAQMNMLEAAGEGDREEWEDVDEEFEGIEDEASTGQTNDIEMS